MYPITVPMIYMFEYQAWLAQNYMYPVIHYVAYPDGWHNMVIQFTMQESRDKFEKKWKHTFEQ